MAHSPLETAGQGVVYIPEKLRRYGLTDAHKRPLVSQGKQPNGQMCSFRVRPEDAWAFPSLELRTGNSFPCLTLDVDGEAVEAFVTMLCDRALPPPNISVTRVSSGNLHATWFLRDPVHRGEHARSKPLHLYATIGEYYRAMAGADPGYTGVLTHNPLKAAQIWTGADGKCRRQLITSWIQKGGYTLGELASVIPIGWTKPTLPTTEAGRNCALFEAGMRWAGSRRNLVMDVLSVLLTTNSLFPTPLPDAEVRSISKGVERYRKRWIAEGKFFATDSENARRCQRAGVQSHNRRTHERDFNWAVLHLCGWSIPVLAKAFNKHERTIQRAVHRFRVVTRPIFPDEIAFRSQLSGTASQFPYRISLELIRR